LFGTSRTIKAKYITSNFQVLTMYPTLHHASYRLNIGLSKLGTIAPNLGVRGAPLMTMRSSSIGINASTSVPFHWILIARTLRPFDLPLATRASWHSVPILANWTTKYSPIRLLLSVMTNEAHRKGQAWGKPILHRVHHPTVHRVPCLGPLGSYKVDFVQNEHT